MCVYTLQLHFLPQQKKKIKMKDKTMNIFFFFFFTCFFSIFSPLNARNVSPLPSFSGSAPQNRIPAVYAFGDSTLDSGNNDYITTLFTGDHLPYGRDFPGHAASGRFTNGRLTGDFLVSYLGLKRALPPYLAPNLSDQELLSGVSFASAGTGFDELTAQTTSVINMDTQIRYFRDYLGKINKIDGAQKSAEIIKNGLFVISAGTNDMVFNYYDLPLRTVQYSLPQYHDFLLHRLESVVQRTIGSLLPGQHILQRICTEKQNLDTQAYNQKLQNLIQRFQATLPGSIFAYTDCYGPMMDMVINPSKYWFEVTGQGCCGTGMIEMGFLCSGLLPACSDASKYMFWDAVHPTEATYRTLASILQQSVLPRFLV
ncbi:hypothetical protein C5167_002314 [Papaver somniferum]|uniref:GDSL esterase/lipase n=1 Tax=Papaver somniferum TaxID=3469 RepID=A0A4Y7KZ89_PAPSO|nr:hypothetical protein C5167_002314 [Papaver somniferum]